MNSRKQELRLVLGLLTLASIGSLVACVNLGAENAWRPRNAAVVKAHNLSTRDRTIPETDVPLGLIPGKAYASSELPVIDLAAGVKATVSWGAGVMVELVEMEAEASYAELALNEEVITIVQEGSATCIVGNQTYELTKDSLLYLTPGARRSLKAGSDGLKAIDVFSPVRVDHLVLAGHKLPLGGSVSFPEQDVVPSIEAGKLYNLNEIQWTPLTPPESSKSYPRSQANARLIWGKNVQLSVIRMDPHSKFPLHIHPEDQIMVAFRGYCNEGVMDGFDDMHGAKRSTILLPSNMAHSGEMGEVGADAIDVFWPVRPDYIAKAQQQNARFREVIAEDVRPVKLAEGFVFAEGSVWLNDKLYFTDMYFEPHNNWVGDPGKSRLIEMSANGSYKVLTSGMQMNGTILSKGRNLLVCDMFGHRVIEVDPSTGEVVRVVLDNVDGKSIDGPNDLVMDAKGGIYVSDPQFTPDAEKNQPGTQVYYVAPDGSSKVVIPAGEFAMPNGVEVSPDGKTFYVNNTWKSPGDNFVWAYDIQEDGSLANKRIFAELNVTPEMLSNEDVGSRRDTVADGMAVDTDGRLYVTTLAGVQIFDKTGAYIGTIWLPKNAANCAFGGENGDILYMVGWSNAWAIQTKVKGFRHPGL